MKQSRVQKPKAKQHKPRVPVPPPGEFHMNKGKRSLARTIIEEMEDEIDEALEEVEDERSNWRSTESK